MERGFYRLADPETSTEDWLRLNFNAYSNRIFESLLERDVSVLEDLIRVDIGEEPEEPDLPIEPLRSDYLDSELLFFQGVHNEWYAECELRQATYEEEYAEWEQSQQVDSWPAMWGTVWGARDNQNLRDSLAESGFVVYATQGPMEDFGDLVFGINGCGYDFYASHWLPLRAALCRVMWIRGNLDDDRFARIMNVLARVYEAKGGGKKEEFINRFCQEKNAA